VARLREQLCDEVSATVGRRLAVSVRDFVVEAAEGRQADGRLAFHDLLVLTRQLLRSEHGADVRRALRQRYQRLLLDEFQDTDPIQIELAVLLASPDGDAGGQPWPDMATAAGRLFFVGDPKQSIYRFRRADIGLYLRARDAFSDGDPVRLVTNFRSAPVVIDWVNHVFDRLIRLQEGSQPEYQPLAAAPHRQNPRTGPRVAVLGIDVLGVHAVLQTIDLETGVGVEEAAAGQAAAEGVLGREEDIVFLARSALASPTVRASIRFPRWRETYVAMRIGDTTVEGYVDLMYRTPEGLVIVDYKTASGSDDLDARAVHYRGQGATYALAVEEAAGETVAAVVFVFQGSSLPTVRSTGSFPTFPVPSRLSEHRQRLRVPR
jgi:ATP-dependent exoDNAse (exonuclease V) beta subunit